MIALALAAYVAYRVYEDSKWITPQLRTQLGRQVN